jgi:hypothetical protein
VSNPRRLVCFDVESYLIAVRHQAPRVVCAGVYGDGVKTEVLAAPELREWLAELLPDKSIVWVNQNPAFDFAAVSQMWPELMSLIFDAYEERRVGCTMLAAHLHDIAKYGTNKGGRIPLDINLEDEDLGDRQVEKEFEIDEKEGKAYINLGKRPYNLGALTRRFAPDFEVDKGNEWRLRFGELDGLPVSEYPPEAYAYAQDDAVAALAVWRSIHHSAYLDGLPLDNVYDQTYAQFALKLTTATGLWIDPVYHAGLLERATKAREAAKDTLLRHKLIRRKKGESIVRYEQRFDRHRAPLQKLAEKFTGETSLAKANVARLPDGIRSMVEAYQQSAKLKAVPSDVDPEIEAALIKVGVWVHRRVRKVIGYEVLDEYTASTKVAQEYAEVAEATRDVKLPRTPKGSIKINPDTARLLDDDPVMAAYAAWTRSSSVLAELDRLERGINDPIHGEYHVLKETGRTSSGGGFAGINMQNRRSRTKGFREVFVPWRDHVLLPLDYSQIELCGLAQVQYNWFGRSALGDAINAGQDAHVLMASDLLELSYDDAINLKKQRDKKLKTYRTMSKALNFGLPGGLGENKFIVFAMTIYKVKIKPTRVSTELREGYVEIDPELMSNSLYLTALPEDLRVRAEASSRQTRSGSQPIVFIMPDGVPRVPTWWVAEQTGTVYVLNQSYEHLRSMWYKRYPEMPMYFDRVKDIRSRNGDAIVQEVSGRMRARTTFCSASNSFFQGLVADGAKAAGCALSREAYVGNGPLRGTRPVVFVHDEWVLMSPLDRFRAAAEAGCQIMVEQMQRYIPDVRVVVEPAAMRRWTKDADEARYNSRGELVCEEDWRLNQGLEEWASQVREDLDACDDAAQCDKLQQRLVALDAERRDLSEFFARHKLERMSA